MRPERGSAAVELVLVTPVLVVLMLFVVAGGRLASTRAEVDAVARDAPGPRRSSAAPPPLCETAALPPRRPWLAGICRAGISP